jgi:hypothetical protein
MTKLVSAALAALLCIAAFTGAAEAASRYRNSTNANGPGPMVHQPTMKKHHMKRHAMRRHHMHWKAM